MLRRAVSADADALAALQAGAFGFREHAERIAGVREEIAAHPESWVVLEAGAGPLATAHVLPQRLRVGSAVLLKADVGGVAVAPERQAGGLGTRLMREIVAFQRAEGFALSRLGGLARFYGRFGWQRFPRRYVEFAVGQEVPAGNSRVREGAVPLAPGWAEAVQPYDPAAHGPAVRDLLRAFTARYTGSPAIDGDGDVPPAGAYARVFLEGGRPIAYLRGCEFAHEHTEFEARITLGEVAADITQLHGLQALLAGVVNDALARGIPRVTARLPFDPAIISALSALPLRFQLIETFGGASSNMLMVASLPALCTQLLPELNARLAAQPARWHGRLGLEMDDQAVTLALGDRVEVTVRPPAARVRIPPYHLMAMTLGLLSFAEAEPAVQADALPPDARAVLRALFPRQLVYSGFWG